MTVCLYECLKAAGLQRHYARFTLVGVSHAAHLSALRIEDYPLLGISSMEDRTRLFHLVQMVKTLDLKSLTNDDIMIYNGNNNGGDEDYIAVEGRFSSDRNPDVSEDQNQNVAFMESSNASSFVRSQSACRRLDINGESPHPVHVSSSHNRNDEPVQEKQSVMRLKPLSRNAVYGHQKSKNNKLDVVSCSCDCHDKENLRRGSSVVNSDVNFMPIRKTSHKPNSNPATGTSKTFSSKLFGRKTREGISVKKNLSADTMKLIPVYVAKRTAGYNYGLPLSSPQSPDNKHVGGRRISVCVRKRPLTRGECRRGEADVVTTPGGDCVIVHEGKEAVDLTEYILQHRFYFDQVFGKESSNEEVYQKTAYPLIQHMLNGGKATCFAYGQTGAGKTHTMLGLPPWGPGLYALAVRDIFAHLSTTHTYSSLQVYVSFFEIYCSQLYDLLDNRKRLFAREDGQKVVHISGLRNVRVDSVNSLLKVISQGTAERTQGTSSMNPHSSRSHALLQIQLRYSNQQTAGRMWFVDLAGSERASDAKEPDRQTRMEGAEINQSLLALKECIRSLDKEESHTPFRQSKLTQVLKDSFVGDSMTCMIANISPGHHATEHTLNTLRYADRVKELKGQGEVRGRRYKMGPSSKHNMSHSSRSRSKVGPPKERANQSETSEPKTPASRLHTAGTFLCSTPKNCRCGEETRSRDRKEMGLEHVTPVRVTKGDAGSWSKTADEREGRRMEIEGFDIHYVREKSTPVVRRKTFERKQNKVQTTKRESGFHLREKENPQHFRKETVWTEKRNQAEINKDMNSNAEQQRERCLQKADNKEKVRHLRQYHQQLQQFTPSLTSSSGHLLSSSSCLSSSYSTQDSLSLLLDSSRLMFFTNKDHSLEEIPDAFRSRAEVNVDPDRRQVSLFGGETRVESDTPTICYRNKDAGAYRSGVGENQRLDESESERKRLGEESVRRVDERLPRGKQPWCAWVEETEVESANSMPRAIPTHVEAHLSHSCDLEDRRGMRVVGLKASDVPDKGEWTTDYFGSQHQRAPAERPLSPSCNALLTSDKLNEFPLESKNAKCGGNILISPLQNTLEAKSSNSHKERKMFFLANPSLYAQSPVTATRNRCIKPADCPVYTHSCNHTNLKAQISVSPQDESNVDSFSYVMDPLSSSLLDVDQQAASVSFPMQKSQPTSNYKTKVSSLQPSVSVLTPLMHAGNNSSPAAHNPTECSYNEKSPSITARQFSVSDHLGDSNHSSNSKVLPKPKNATEPSGREDNNQQIIPTMHFFTTNSLEHVKWCVVEAHLEQLKQMEAFCHKEGKLLWQQNDMAFGEYVHILAEILEGKARCLHNMRAQLQPYLKSSQSSTQGDENHDTVMSNK